MLGAEQGVVDGGVAVQGGDLGGGRVGVDEGLGLEREDGQVVLGVDAEQLVAAELQDRDRRAVRQRQHHLDALLPKDVDLAVAKWALGGAHGDERLHRVVGDLRDLGVDAIVADLRARVSAWDAGPKLRLRGERALARTWSGMSRSGPQPCERSLLMPACFPRRRCAMVWFCGAHGLLCAQPAVWGSRRCDAWAWARV